MFPLPPPPTPFLSSCFKEAFLQIVMLRYVFLRTHYHNIKLSCLCICLLSVFCILFLIANHLKFSGLNNNHFITLMNSVGQEFGQNTVGWLVSMPRCVWGHSWEVSKAAVIGQLGAGNI